LKSVFFIFSSLFLISAFAQQFKSGNQFFSVPVYGQVFIRCQNASSGEYKQASFTCSDLRLSPVEYDYFVGPAGMNADRVVLTAIQQSGHKVEKKISYQNNQSTKRINLWIQSLLQKPLLDEGLNRISYKLYSESQVVSEGSFDVPVVRGQSKTCPNGNIVSTTMSDCDSPYTACQKYFYEYNYCF